jgi:hypothetical protein
MELPYALLKLQASYYCHHPNSTDDGYNKYQLVLTSEGEKALGIANRIKKTSHHHNKSKDRQEKIFLTMQQKGGYENFLLLS